MEAPLKGHTQSLPFHTHTLPPSHRWPIYFALSEADRSLAADAERMVGESIQMKETKSVMVSRDLSLFPRPPVGQIRVECGDKEGEKHLTQIPHRPTDRTRPPLPKIPTAFPASHDLLLFWGFNI